MDSALSFYLGSLSVEKPGEPAVELPLGNEQLPRASFAVLSNKGGGKEAGGRSLRSPVIMSVQSWGITVED